MGFRRRAQFHTSGGVDAMLSLLVLAALALLAGAAMLRRREGRATLQIWLMIVAALVLFANALIVGLPV